MTDLSQPAAAPAPLFQVHLRTEPIDTAMFGTVNVHEISSRRLSALYASTPPESKGEEFGFALLCETCVGPNGERFTREILEDLPNRALRDMAVLLRTAVSVNGIDQKEVGKA